MATLKWWHWLIIGLGAAYVLWLAVALVPWIAWSIWGD